jgi:transposase
VYCVDAELSTATAVCAAIVLELWIGGHMADQIRTPQIIGVDVSSREIVTAWAHANKPPQTVANHRKGILTWLGQLPTDAVIGMEATGRFHQLLADEAVARGHTVYVINPKHLAAYARGIGQRGKTDPLDAQVIARYVDRERDQLHPYVAPTALQRALRNLLSQRAGLVRHSGAIKQNLQATQAGGGALKRAQQKALQSLSALIAEIDAELKRTVAAHAELDIRRRQLQQITGIGFLNSMALTHRFDRTPFANSDAVVAAYGLDPKPRDSGKHVGKRYLTKQGNPEDRRLIYLAAQSATKTTLFKPYYAALIARGFATTEAIVIIARKILRIAFAVWTSGKPFDPTKIGIQSCQKP